MRRSRFLLSTRASVILLLLAAAAAAAPPTAETLHQAVQQICPVSGQRLGDHGPPVRVLVGEQQQEIFLCCKSCLDKQIDPGHWATIHANMAKAQQICPVMKNPLPAKAAWQIVGGRVVFVCCPPCLDKIAAKPKPYLAAIDELYAESLAGPPKP